MKIGAGTIAAERFGAKELIDPCPYAVSKIAQTFNIYENMGTLLPAMGYGVEQLKDLEETINKTDCDAVIIGTPMDLSRIININKPYTRVHYELDEVGSPNLKQILSDFIKANKLEK